MKTRFPKKLRKQIEEICYDYGIQRISWDIQSECSKYFNHGKTINIRKYSDESLFHEIIHFILMTHQDKWIRQFYGSEHEIVAEYFKFEIIYPLASDNLEDCLNEWNEWRGEWYLSERYIKSSDYIIEYIYYLIDMLYSEPLLIELSECFHTFLDQARLKLNSPS